MSWRRYAAAPKRSAEGSVGGCRTGSTYYRQRSAAITTSTRWNFRVFAGVRGSIRDGGQGGGPSPATGCEDPGRYCFRARSYLDRTEVRGDIGLSRPARVPDDCLGGNGFGCPVVAELRMKVGMTSVLFSCCNQPGWIAECSGRPRVVEGSWGGDRVRPACSTDRIRAGRSLDNRRVVEDTADVGF